MVRNTYSSISGTWNYRNSFGISSNALLWYYRRLWVILCFICEEDLTINVEFINCLINDTLLVNVATNEYADALHNVLGLVIVPSGVVRVLLSWGTGTRARYEHVQQVVFCSRHDIGFLTLRKRRQLMWGSWGGRCSGCKDVEKAEAADAGLMRRPRQLMWNCLGGGGSWCESIDEA